MTRSTLSYWSSEPELEGEAFPEDNPVADRTTRVFTILPFPLKRLFFGLPESPGENVGDNDEAKESSSISSELESTGDALAMGVAT